MADSAYISRTALIESKAYNFQSTRAQKRQNRKQNPPEISHGRRVRGGWGVGVCRDYTVVGWLLRVGNHWLPAIWMFAKRTWLALAEQEEQEEHPEGNRRQQPGQGYISIDFKIMRTNKSWQRCCYCCCSLNCPKERGKRKRETDMVDSNRWLPPSCWLAV